MIRVDLPEIEDSPACPAWMRNAMTSYLQVVHAVARPYVAVAPLLARLLRESGEDRVVDLASGGGGPWPGLVEQLSNDEGVPVEVTLTDLHPNATAASRLERLPGLTYRREPVSALAIPPSLRGVRTMFTGLHHFDPDQLRTIFRAAQEARIPFLAAEMTHRSARGLLIPLFIPLLVLLLMPRVRPRRALPLLFTYLPPLLPLVIWWDGFASTMKAYRAAELEEILSELREPGYVWRVEEVPTRGAPIPVTVVVGNPGTAAA